MTGPAWVLLLVAAVFGVCDWVAVARGDRRTEYVCKPATILALIGVAITLDAPDPGAQVLFVLALLLSGAGDVFLMLPDDQFAAGLGFFLGAHVAYIAGLSGEISSGSSLLVAAGVVAAGVLVVGPRIVAGTRRRAPEMRIPVIVYIGAIAAMATVAGATLDPLAALGALLLLASDALIGWNRFVARLAWAPVAIIVTYHLGQAGLVLSLTT